MSSPTVRPARGLARRATAARCASALVVALASVGAADLAAQAPRVHYHHAGNLAPGAIGRQQLTRGGPLAGYVQPVEIKVPHGTLVSLAANGSFDAGVRSSRTVGLFIAPVYRLKITSIPNREGEEVFPTLELVDRVYPPRGQERKFAIPIEIRQDELEMALDGKFITRVIYVENPGNAIPHAELAGEQNWHEIGAGEDPLAAADRYGRPVAILRIGGREPSAGGPDAEFLFGSPRWVCFDPLDASRQLPNATRHAQRAPAQQAPLKQTPVGPPARESSPIVVESGSPDHVLSVERDLRDDAPRRR